MKARHQNLETKRTVENKAVVKQLLIRHYGNVRAACLAANISKSQFYKWLEIDSDFASAVESIRFRIRDFSTSELVGKVEMGDLQTLLKLQRRMNRRLTKTSQRTSTN